MILTIPSHSIQFIPTRSLQILQNLIHYGFLTPSLTPPPPPLPNDPHLRTPPSSSSPHVEQIHCPFSAPLCPLDSSSPEIIIKHLNIIYPTLTAESINPQQRANSTLTNIFQELETNFDEKSPDKQGYFLYNKTLHKIKDSQKSPCPENSTSLKPSSPI